MCGYPVLLYLFISFEKVLSLFLDRDFTMADAYVEQMASLEAMGLFQDVFQVLSDMRTEKVRLTPHDE